jgi:hypothetical protein
MPDQLPVANSCSKCGLEMVLCRYNRFHRGDLRIDAWEHKCGNCGSRETIAYRNDNEEGAAILKGPATCPYCGRSPTSAA